MRRPLAILAAFGLPALAAAAAVAQTTISSEDQALTRSRSAESMATVMPAGPPGLSTAGAAVPVPAPAPVLSTGTRPIAEGFVAAEPAPTATASGGGVTAPASDPGGAPEAPSRRRAWPLLLGGGAAVFILAVALRRLFLKA